MIKYNTPVNIFYDNDEMLWYTKIGTIKESTNGSLPLHYTVWGKSKAECYARARQLVTILHNAQTINEAKLV